MAHTSRNSLDQGQALQRNMTYLPTRHFMSKDMHPRSYTPELIKVLPEVLFIMILDNCI